MRLQVIQRSKWFLRMVLLAALVPSLTGCPKTTGGGWFLSYDEYDDAVIPVSFGFTAQPTGNAGSIDDAKGRFTLVAHHLDRTITRIQGYLDITGAELYASPNPETGFVGRCRVNGEAGYYLEVQSQDFGEPGPSAGDGISIAVRDEFSSVPDYVLYWEGYLEGGNIQVHQKD